ncbi:phosphatidylinositol-specific phospholipase C domain-containing protein [Pseudoalteromonas sp. OOF1S-7]|uniref:phosphatidylinositol-specific phospholipase C domain-containing protein n=1 Tax=Pseudoalteromonas sp. OOF1S-7 TaxID=2917757 RepID=UPI001EF74369|nr:phosphatidylinositol-specific phospholipase C domain-containing protein [Pseudoalteromonas sp. OOF1S-7]MCG7537357.1 hypothetical protein [Pseudoalteromonas sp. OOF1S-7]
MKPGNLLNKPAWLLACVLAASGLSLSANAAIDTDDDKVTRLDLQGQIDNFAPFSKTLWAGAHNAYASHSWSKGTYTDVNQYYSPKSLLKRGIRVMEFDIYPESTADSTPMLCHNSRENEAVCSAFHAKLSEGLDDIKDFLKDNPDEVILLKIESYKHNNHNNWHNKIGERLKNDIGDYLLLPSDWGYADKSCASLPVSYLSKRDILAAGKQLVAVVQTPRDHSNLCSYHKSGSYSKFWNTVFIGVDAFNADGDLKSNQPFCQNGSNKCLNGDQTDHYNANNMTVVIDGATQLNTDGPDADKTGSNVISKWANKGAQILELALVEANNTSAASGYGANEVQIEDYIWSWKSNRPNNSGNCASLEIDSSIVDKTCETYQYHACVDENRNWKLTTSKGSWEMGFANCQNLGGSYTFAMPFNAYEQVQLNNEIGLSSESHWVNYYRAFEDFWLSNSASNIDWMFFKSAALGSTNKGDAFSGLDLLKRKALVGGTFNLSSVRIRSKDRVDGFEACYTTSQSVSHASVGNSEICVNYGGNGGSWGNQLTFDVSKGDYLKSMKVCRDDSKYGYSTVYSLELTSSDNRKISGGTNSGICATLTFKSGLQLFAFHGTQNKELNSIGAYYIDSSLVNGGLFATDWLDHDDPSGGDNELFITHQSLGNIGISCSTADVATVVARVVGNKLDASLTGQNLVNNNSGFACWNSSNGGNSSYVTCEDYEVRYFFTKASCVP